ncbi:ORF167 (chloroplast) [Klebsormidium nitens]|uniref:ORF167 n=1 Tax=Klebsormidium nitens TaxID=105231 RepID=A0A0U9HMU2_KLENI|nr:ORF167 [Klebsormidium nitens]|eukprot:GAQ93801.1 ORF167 (chloroplast) [Klebsormidium nitens]
MDPKDSKIDNESMSWVGLRWPSEAFIPFVWLKTHKWKTEKTWLRGGTLVLNLHENCVIIYGSHGLRRRNNSEIILPLDLLGINPTGLTTEELWNTVELKLISRFYLTSCYEEICIYENEEKNRSNLVPFLLISEKWVKKKVKSLKKKAAAISVHLEQIKNIIKSEEF